MATNEKYLLMKEKEVCWSVDEPECMSTTLDAIMEEATPSSGPLVSQHVSRTCKQGSKHQASTGFVKVTKVTAQLKEQERIADTTKSLVTFLWDPDQLKRQQHLLTPPAQDIGLVVPPMELQQGSSKKMFVSDLATLWQDLLSCSPARLSKAISTTCSSNLAFPDCLSLILALPRSQ